MERDRRGIQNGKKTQKEGIMELGINYCPFCGFNLRTHSCRVYDEAVHCPNCSEVLFFSVDITTIETDYSTWGLADNMPKTIKIATPQAGVGIKNIIINGKNHPTKHLRKFQMIVEYGEPVVFTFENLDLDDETS